MFKSVEDYKALYSQYIDLAVELHNYHLVFLTHWGYRPATGIRRTLRSMKEVQKKLSKMSLVAQKDFKKFSRELKRKQKEDEKAWRKANPKPKGRPKGIKSNVKHNRTDETST